MPRFFFYHRGCFAGRLQLYFYDWYEGQYDVRFYLRGENNEILKDAIAKGDYDAAANTVTVIGEFEGEEPFTAVFSYNENNSIVWTENGESVVPELSLLDD
jgi:hypothetical protein